MKKQGNIVIISLRPQVDLENDYGRSCFMVNDIYFNIFWDSKENTGFDFGLRKLCNQISVLAQLPTQTVRI